ncbi:MAG TPA: hypothetical protein PKM21_00450 [Anaerolineales bacterium]|nr:hypothetical protein [Anaerolineales bacterium]
MLNLEREVFCENCGAEITCGAYVINDHIFCCKECYEGYPCTCGERMDVEIDRRSSQPVASYS